MTASLLEDAFLLELDGCVFTLLELEAATEFGLTDEEDPSAGSGTLENRNGPYRHDVAPGRHPSVILERP